MIDWLNDNQGFSLALLTFVYVAATVLIALTMKRSNELARNSLDLATQLDKNRSRPYVIFDLLMEKHLVHAVVKNIGLTAATHIKVNIDPPLLVTANKEKNISILVASIIEFLPPNREFKDFIDVSHNFIKFYPKIIFKGDISYKDIQGTKYIEPIHMDLEFQKDLTEISEKDIGREIEKLADKVEKIGRVMEKWKIGT